ncbi:MULTISPECIES: hypothetical protein [unclassified Streptococcus]|uniref:hypothetical protein n=1 Tax=unclassified Streptococcus TaxID=2608887 RepID=UPI00211B405F|nr:MULTISPECIES: hypothetical protein [unclassified Streptococcus]MCQ9212397.1 hypothetical protein [Streptococcus sp. B01]MCQ9213737.1 hypothetical protein [Streptococcus sp. O1]MCQ9214502.1 hypothetical protein [Streptococcus sp. O1]
MKESIQMNLAAGDPFVKTTQASQELTGKIQGIALVVFIAACVITGLIYGLGGQEVKKIIKKYWWGIAVGIVVVTGAAGILTYLWDFANIG